MVTIGLERLLTDAAHHIAHRRVGLLCNPVSVDRGFRHAADLIHGAGEGQLVRLFGPEHGVRGAAQDMIAVEDQVDPDTGIPVVSLYGPTEESLRPKPSDLEGIDVLVCDLQDIGSRYYTYVWTVVLCLEVCAELDIPVVVCDRPNPLGGLQVEGGTIEPGFESFVGLHPVPNRHGLTLGELVLLARAERGIDGPLEVVTMEGWERGMDFDATGRPWVLPSPNMPTLDTAYVYPGLCLVEATELSEGRGTTRPFELVGAPYIDPPPFAKALNARGLPGVTFRPTWFRPQFQKHAGRDCGGVQLHVSDRAAFAPYRTGVELLATARALHPQDFAWREHPYEFVADVPAIDLLSGSKSVREAIEAGSEPADLRSEWEANAAAFRERRRPHLLY